MPPGDQTQQEQEIFLFSKTPTTAPRPLPPIQWVSAALSQGVKPPGRGADHSPASSVQVKYDTHPQTPPPHMPSWPIPRAACPIHLIFLDFISPNIIGENTNYWGPLDGIFCPLLSFPLKFKHSIQHVFLRTLSG
jgi:hypothetical protein